MGVAVDSEGKIIIADKNNCRVVVIRGGKEEREGGEKEKEKEIEEIEQENEKEKENENKNENENEKHHHQQQQKQIIQIIPMIYSPLSVAVDQKNTIIIRDSEGVVRGIKTEKKAKELEREEEGGGRERGEKGEVRGGGGERERGERGEKVWEGRYLGGGEGGIVVYEGRIVVGDSGGGDIKVLYNPQKINT